MSPTSWVNLSSHCLILGPVLASFTLISSVLRAFIFCFSSMICWACRNKPGREILIQDFYKETSEPGFMLRLLLNSLVNNISRVTFPQWHKLRLWELKLNLNNVLLPTHLTWIHCSRVTHDNVRVSACVKRPLIVYCYHIGILVVIVIDVIEIVVVAGSVVAGRRVVRVLLEIVSKCIEKV